MNKYQINHIYTHHGTFNLYQQQKNFIDQKYIL